MQPEKETFEYDALDRLVAVKTGNASSLNISYANNGNITSKTDVGNYTYSSVKPHAVMKVDNADAYQYTSDMTTEYNDMGRIKLISQRQTYPINMSFAYGADGSLWNMNYTPSGRSTDIGGHRAWSRYYDDNYEYLQSAAFMNGFGIGMTVGTFNHTGGDVKTIERKLPPVYVVADNLSYRKTFGYWLLGVGPCFGFGFSGGLQGGINGTSYLINF